MDIGYHNDSTACIEHFKTTEEWDQISKIWLLIKCQNLNVVGNFFFENVETNFSLPQK